MSYTPFDAIQIGIASPEKILSWSYGEVTKPETINYRTLKPEQGGLYCQKIFGPVKDWECFCGRYKKIRYKGKVCEKCGVEVTKAKVRRERMGHIELAAPVSHIWYFKGIPSRMGLLLDQTPRTLEKVLYFASYIVIDPGDTPLKKYQLLSEQEYNEYREKYEDDFRAGMGAEAIRELLAEINLEQLSNELRDELKNASGQKKAKIVKRLEVVDAFLHSGNRPEWMIITILPVIPPDIRPMVQLDGGRFATSDLNDLYRRVINRNNRLKRLLDLKAPDIIIRNEKRMLQEAVDSLIDNGRRGRAVVGANARALKSLSDMLKGKQGRFRQNLLGKRVDYSGRSVIVVGPSLKLYQCGVPKEMAIELFRPFVMKKLVEDGKESNIKSAKKAVDRQKPDVWDALDVVIKEHPVLLNRAPTLHRLGIQAFEPVLVEGRALKLHPLVCTAYNADFDGDQMAIHVPLSAEAQAEARILMLSVNNLLRPQDGHPVTVPTQDMVLGSYYLTMERFENNMSRLNTEEFWPENIAPELCGRSYKDLSAEEKANIHLLCFRDPDEAVMAYASHNLGLHQPVRVRITKTIGGEEQTRLITTTVGQIIFNVPIPQDLGFVDRSDPEHAFEYEVSFRVDKGKLGKIIDKCIQKHGFTIASEMLDDIKAQGYSYSTRSALTISIADMMVPGEKKTLIKDTEDKVITIEKQYKRGFITDEERYRLVVSEWEKTTDAVTRALMDNLDEWNPINMMATSGARGSRAQIRQLAGMRGLMANTAGKTIEIPIKANFREGLSVLEYFISTRGARKGLADTALRTADSGYLTRRMVDVSQDVIIREDDCGTKEGVPATAMDSAGHTVLTFDQDHPDYDNLLRSFEENIHGRFPVEPVCDPKTGEVLCDTDTMLMSSDAKELVKRGITRIVVRSVLSCEAKNGVCARCYGLNLATGQPVNAGEAVGVIAAQSIGEPGTQLTMRTFHTGGVAGDDITQGLPRVEELFEARRPKKTAMLSEISGTVHMEDGRKNGTTDIRITSDANDGEVKVYNTPTAAGILVAEGDHVDRGQELTRGALAPKDVLEIRGVDDDEFGRSGVRNYLVQEVQKVYRQQGVDINNKHIEVIVRQMMRKCTVEDPGDTELLSGAQVDYALFRSEYRKIQARIEAGETELRLPQCKRILLGITKASLAIDSWMSAASFQETTKVLTEAAINGKVDHLNGLKENVIIGKLIPAGSGLQSYHNFTTVTDEDKSSETEFVDLTKLVSLTNAL